MRRDGGDDDWWMGLLVGFDENALPHFRHQGSFRRDVPEFAGQIIRWLPRPDSQDMLDRLDKHGAPVSIQVLEHFHVGKQPTRPDSKHETPFQQVVEHRYLRRDLGGMIIWQVDRT